MKIGILLCAYQHEEYLEGVLAPWFVAQEELAGLFDIKISAVSCLFKEYEDMSFNKDNSKTIDILQKHLSPKQILSIAGSGGSLKESEARNLALNPIKDCDVIWMVDGDEFYTLLEIKNILGYIKAKPFIAWFKINFKNHVFDGMQWVDGFCPPRIFRTKINKYELGEFYWDNDLHYLNKEYGKVKYTELSSLEIPRTVAHVKHMTWLNTEKCKRKVEYQMKHFGHCGYKWNNEKDCLEFNEEFHTKHGIPIPKLNK